MKIGVFLFPEGRDPSRDHAYISETVEEALAAERLGADAVFLAEHHFDGNCAYVDPPTFASHLAALTSRIKIGFAVLQASLYHPLRIAEQLSLLDQLSRGRLIVGLGRGSLFNTHEYKGFQIEPSSAQERFEEIEEILLECWNGDKVSHSGKYWDFEIERLRPRPYSRPHPQILRSVASEASVVREARKGRPVILGSPDARSTAKMVAIYRSTMAEAGFSARQVDEALAQSWASRPVIVAPTDREAIEVGVPYVEAMRAYRAAQSESFQAQLSAAKIGEGQVSGILAGAPSSVVQEFRDLQDTGVGGVISRFRIGPMPADFALRSLTLFMEEVVPALRADKPVHAAQ